MKNSSYPSVPVIVSIIGAESRKAMYLTHIRSLDGQYMYKDKWVPTSWDTQTVYEWRYTNKPLGIINQLITPGKYYQFHFDGSVLMTKYGPVNEHGAKLDVPGLTRVKLSAKRQTIEWDYDSQSLVEFPMTKVTPSMVIDDWTGNCSNIKARLVDNKVQEYLQLTDRYVVYLPMFIIKTMKKIELNRYNEAYYQESLFPNDDNPHTVIEETSINSHIQMEFDYIDRTESYTTITITDTYDERSALKQWERDNPDYQSYTN